MVYKCAVAECQNTQINKSKDVLLHRFPVTNNSICKVWITKCQRKNNINSRTARICSEHFTKQDYERDLKSELLGLPLKRKLKSYAVPTVFAGRGCKSLIDSSKQRRLQTKQLRKNEVKDLLKEATDRIMLNNLESCMSQESDRYRKSIFNQNSSLTMETTPIEKSALDLQQESAEYFNNIHIKPGIANDAGADADPFEGDELEAKVKVVNYTDNVCDNLGENFIKFELVEFYNNADPTDIKAVMLEKIPKMETKFLDDEPLSSENETNGSYHISIYGDSDMNSDPELDPFADIDSDPSFSLVPPTRPISKEKPNCGSAFITNEQLLNHMGSHLAETPLKCPPSQYCDRMIKTKATFRNHLKVHIGARRRTATTKVPVKCEKCGRGFRYKSCLTRHLESHTQRMIKCPEPNCNKILKNLQSIKDHVTMVHLKKDAAASFVCPEPNCGKTFKIQKYMRDHFKSVHTRPYKCKKPGCTAAFSRPNLLSTHVILQHTIIKKY